MKYIELNLHKRNIFATVLYGVGTILANLQCNNPWLSTLNSFRLNCLIDPKKPGVIRALIVSDKFLN